MQFLKLSAKAVFLFLLFAFPLFAQTHPSDEDIHKIVERIDELYRANSSYSVMEMDIVTPHWERTLKMKIWTEGKKKTFIRITEPAKEQGVGTLRIGNEMWNYLPKTNKVIKVPPSMMMSSWMGSDFNNDDLVKEFTMVDDYTYQLITPPNPGPGLLYIRFIPKEGLPIVWGKIIISARAEDYIPVQENYYDDKGKLMRVMNFKDIKVFDGRKIPSVLELIPQTEEGHKTVLRYIEAKFNLDIGNDVFTLRHLRASD